ncbi:hypothetical protein PIGHUM_03977 [Pigmentiphaga humi]|uniref:Uncharacterized protein n=1 Tax=Pigmentiphaga humi TaxID=2478468 RepID=A0A3P4B8P0_9BURK|nr:hypothetical protein PIGHUM_03977 [Pigmentiphaga humi]
MMVGSAMAEKSRKSWPGMSLSAERGTMVYMLCSVMVSRMVWTTSTSATMSSVTLTSLQVWSTSARMVLGALGSTRG